MQAHFALPSSLLCLVVVWSWDQRQWVSIMYRYVRAANKKTTNNDAYSGGNCLLWQHKIPYEGIPKRKQTNLFPGMSRKRNKERRKEIPETDPDPSTQVTVLPESQRIFTQLTQWWSNQTFDIYYWNEKKKTLVSLVKPSDQNHKRYVDITADGNINDIQTVKMKSSHHTYKPGLVCFWCVAESCWETMDGRWKRGFYHTNTHCFPQTCCSSTLRTNLLRSLQDINSHLNVKLQLCVMKFQKGYGPIVQSFLHRKSCTKVEYTCWCIQKSSEKETVHLQVFSATDSHNTGFPLLLQSAEALRLSGSATCRQELSGKLRHPISHHHHSQHMITGTHKVCQKTKKGQLDEQ